MNLIFNDFASTMKFATLIIIACLSVTVESLGSLRFATAGAELAQEYNPEIVHKAVVNADK